MDEGAGVGESRQEGWAGVRLCNLAAQSALNAERSVQTGGREGTHRAGIGTVGDYLLQAVQDPDSGGRAGDRNGSFDAGHGQVARLLSGDDMRRLPGRSEPGRGRPNGALAVHVTVLQISTRRPATGISG